jgi:hypothetical protein
MNAMIRDQGTMNATGFESGEVETA